MLGGGLVLCVSALVYRVTLAPGVFGWDSAELTLGAYTQGIVHPPGYPLYLMLAGAFAKLPLLPDYAARINLFSAVMGVVTALLLYRIALTLFQQPWIAAGAALLFVVAPEIWQQSVVAEVYSMHTALVGLVLWLLLRWREQPRPWLLYGISFAVGLSFAHHLAAVLAAVVIMPYLWWQRPAWRERALSFLLLSIPPALLYAYLPLRFAAQPDFNLLAGYFQRDLRHLPDLLWFIRGEMFAPEMFGYSLGGWLLEMGRFVGELWFNFLGVGLIVGLLGVVHLWRTQRGLCLLLLAIFGGQVLFFSSYRVFDKWTMFHTAYFVWAIFIGGGAVMLRRSFSGSLVAGLLFATVGLQIALHWNNSGRFEDRFLPQQAQETLAALPPESLFIGSWTNVRPMQYFQIVQGQWTDRQLYDINLFALAVRADRPSLSSEELVQQAVQEAVAGYSGAIYSYAAELAPEGYRAVLVNERLSLYRFQRSTP